MDYIATITHLYYLLICADGNVNEKEILRGEQMVKAEGMDEKKFRTQLELLKSKDRSVIYTNCIAGLKKLDSKQQIRCIAWLCVIANADGFMDKNEWMLIYKIYHTELHLLLDDIMAVQKELNKIIHGKAFQSFGVKVSK